ncbi:hypothetical protein B9Z55_018270 [Caenorhabditis nigoni]|uniref:Methyltransferase FkbM domain-containing protein n=1 Tax=Caenorhabditis nigoni TaxID=1611254 RepID=A0A2G5TDH9_9PELO|nr:hypothetical protein B9Z55_018270 [Caenorhabditis nigoni]
MPQWYCLLNGGHSRKLRFLDKLVILTTLIFVSGLILTMLPEEGNEIKNLSSIFKAFHDCVRPKLTHLEGNYEQFWYLFTTLTEGCDYLEAYKALDIRTVKNQDEIKYVALPHQGEHLTMVTLGIGRDVNAEVKLKELHPNIEFFGADPVSDTNKDLYVNTLGGKYFQYTVREKYEKETTRHIGADYFFKNVLRKDRIDILWIDIEQNEYPILEQLHSDGLIYKKGVKICQIHVELHKNLFEPKSEFEIMKFHDFVWKLLEDKKYIMMKPYHVKGFNFIRTFIVNVSDKECTDLYLK